MTDPVGMPVLDLVCGLFGLLVVMYAGTARTTGDVERFSKPAQFVRVEAKGGERVDLGVRFAYGTKQFQSWPDCRSRDSLRWTCEPGVIEAWIEGDEQISDVGVAVLRHESAGISLGSGPYPVSITQASGFSECTLERTSYFRAELDEC